ncbi:sensor histidine kinase [Massilistercora timonensis]|uniref:sensor histidine kinase n=1 Tax=Massilistercora timonensis TaxID=2086584 RepID=UPI003AB658A2
MRSTLHLKFIIVYIIFAFLSVFTVATLTDTLTSGPLVSVTASNTYQEANMMATDYLPDYFSKEVSLNEVRLQLSGMETHLDAALWFVDREGRLLASAQSEGLPPAPSQIQDFNPAEAGNSQYLTGDYHGYFQEDVITVIAPVIHGYSPAGYLLVHKSLDYVNEVQGILMRAALITLLVIYFLSFIILLALEFFVYRPLRKITEAATQYASGNLDYEIPVRTEDEMGYLSASLNYMSSQLRDMEDYQKKFVANVSHDFRSPLTSIKGYVEAMADGTIPPEMQKKYLGIILFETERLTDLTQDLLTLNEFDSKNLLLNKENFDIHEMIKNVAASFEGTCTQKKISIELLFASKQMEVFADKRKIQQVLYNLLDNAIKFSDPESTVTIETTERGEKVSISVKDYGIGIPRSALGKIWERFYKTDLSRGKDKKGTGLGLAIVKEAIQAHGENISVVSTEGVGTEFIFTLPRAQTTV